MLRHNDQRGLRFQHPAKAALERFPSNLEREQQPKADFFDLKLTDLFARTPCLAREEIRHEALFRKKRVVAF